MRHETAIISPGAIVAETAVIGPYAIIEAGAVIEDDVYIGPHAVVGSPGQHTGSWPAPVWAPKRGKGVLVKRGATIREFVTIHSGLVQVTTVGVEAHVMSYVHVPHDATIGDAATIGSNSVLGGFTLIGENATLGQGVVTHPWVLIGEGAMIGLNSSVVKDVQPYQKQAGSPARLLGSNTHKDASLPVEWTERALSARCLYAYNELVDRRVILKERWANVS